MEIRSFSVENYKGFFDRQEIELAPLTLFYGENSSGKSALVRVLPWIAESMADPRPGPRLDGWVGREALWGDLAHIHRPFDPLVIQLTWAEGHTVEWKVRGGTLPGSCELAALSLRGAGEPLDLADDGDGTWGNTGRRIGGLLPQPPERRWETFLLRVQWLLGVRVSIPRIEKALAAAPGGLLPNGEGVARYLYYWSRRGLPAEREALGFVHRFFLGLGHELTVEEVAHSYFRLTVARQGAAGSPVNLQDTGEGLTQVLAPLLALARAACGLGPRVVCLEQPELHLHTNAQRALASAIAEAVRAGAQVLVETHSEVLLAAIQLEVATARLTSDQVALYWVARQPHSSSVARRVTLDPRGRVSSAWPLSAFDDLLTLKSELFEAQRGRR